MTIEKFIREVQDQFALLEHGEALAIDTKFKQHKAWDSMTSLLVISMIFDNYGVAVTGDDITSIETLGDLYNFIEEKVK